MKKPDSAPADHAAPSQTNATTPREPIAIVGIGCRFPGGASSPKAYWKLLSRGKDAVVDVPRDRWDLRRFYDPNPAKPGKMHVKQGGFLKEKLDQFDPMFFGISPREAESMDPQQRLLLEVTWEGFEDAGIIADNLVGSKTGVFIGGFCLDNMLTRLGAANRELADSHTAANSTMTILSNRISYVFDLRGPSVTMDTACSSSLVATHYACQSIWNGESTLAIAGGVNAMFRPEFPIVMSKGKFLSQHGRCKTFDEEAAGYARGEGAGVVLLKPLSQARRDGDRIYGLIRGTGVNQDGHTPGLSMPNPEAQEALIRSVYEQSQVPPSEIGYVEAHGTGTQVGDLAETTALHRVLSEGRPADQKCYIGSAKTNIGHTEAAAGIAGLIKAVLSLSHEKIAPNLHFNKANPKIPFSDLCVEVSTRLQNWNREEGRVRYAGVNSFGYGGTNAHVVLQEAPLESPAETNGSEEPQEQWNRPYLLPVSARNENALRELAGKYAFYLTTCRSQQALADFCYTVTQRRSAHNHRLAVLAESEQDLRDKLQLFKSGKESEGICLDTADQQRPSQLAFIYTGMGPQWWGMGRELSEAEPVFREALEEFDTLFAEVSGWSILKELQASEIQSRMARTEVAQPANFAIQAALTALWRHWGIEPTAVIGHSVGEVASAYASGALSLKDAVQVSYHRSRLQQTLAGKGAMLAAGLSETEALDRIGDLQGVSLGAINSPSSVTLSGDPEPLAQIAALLQKQDVFNRALAVEVAYHSPQMDAIKDEILASLESIKPQATRLPLYSTVTGALIDGATLDANYWWQNVRQPVRFCQGIQALLEAKFSRFLEVGPHPVLGHSVKEIAAARHAKVRLTPSLNRKAPEHARMLESLGQLYTQGQSVNWSAVIPNGGAVTDLPTYPWQRERYWKESQASAEDRLGNGKPVFLSTRLDAPQPTWSVEVNEQYFPFLRDHKVNGQIVFPGAGYVEAALQLCKECVGRDSFMLRDLTFESMLAVDESQVQLITSGYDETSRRYAIHSKIKEDGASWQRHAAGSFVDGEIGSPSERVDLEELIQSFGTPTPTTEMYAALKRRGLDYGPSFQSASLLYRRGNEVLARIENEHNELVDGNEYLLPPGILDTAFHTLLSIIPGDQPYVPTSATKLVYRVLPGSRVWFRGTILEQDEFSFHADVQLINEDGKTCVEIRDTYMKALPNFNASKASEFRDFLYAPVWVEQANNPTAAPQETDTYIVFANESKLSRGLEAALKAKSRDYTIVTQSETYQRIGANHIQLDNTDPAHFVRLLGDVKSRGENRLLYLWSAEAQDDEPQFDKMMEHCLNLTYLVQAISKRSEGADTDRDYSITLVTSGTQAVTPHEELDPSSLNTAPLWGLGALVENEHDNISCSLVDLDRLSHQELAKNDFNVLLGQRTSGDLALRAGKTFLRRLQRVSLDRDIKTESVSTESPVGLVRSDKGGAEGLYYSRINREEPGPGEIEIKVEYARLGSKDVLKVQGQYPRRLAEGSFSGNAIGMEVSGIVTRIGQGVTAFNEGDRIVSAARDAFRSYAIVPAHYAIPLPPNLDTSSFFIHSDFLTAYHGLIETARLESNERVLIHDATSGLGLAAIQIARREGAEIYATVSSPQKRIFLEKLGVQHIFDTRSLNFADEIERLTEGRGIDVALCPLPGEIAQLTIATLSPYGRFIDASLDGRTPAIEPASALSRRNITIAKIDTDQLLAERPERAKRLLEKIRSGFEQGDFTPIAGTTFPAREIAEAFRQASKGEGIGDTVIRFTGENVDIVDAQSDEQQRFQGGTYLVTGGNNGFGFEVAKWLAAKGATKIVLASRKGRVSESDRPIIEKLRSEGVDIRSQAVDVTQREQVAALLDSIRADGPPLRGIIHGAMVLEDAFMIELDKEKLQKTMAPKVLGALHLHSLTQDCPLDFFVSFSSISSLIGNRGQTNYVAANAFLDSFSHVARKRGCPAKTINWGALAETGVITRNEEVGRLLEQTGVNGLANAQALAAFDAILQSDVTQVGVFDVDWARWSRASPRAAMSSTFSELVQQDSGDEDDKARVILRELEDLDPADHRSHVEKITIEGFCRVLKIPVDKINADQTLAALGIDSLLLLELALTIQTEFGIPITAAELPKHPTIGDLAEGILERLGKLQRNAA